MGPIQPPIEWVAGLSQGCGFGHTPLSSAKVKETVALYPYSVPLWYTVLQIPCGLL
jgi:hypothetical protein